jgi:type IV pilus assembly protein PilX
MSFPRRSFPRRPAARARTAQRGVVLVVVLLALVVLLIGLAALIRSADTAGIMVGNLAFRRDLTNRAEEAIAAAKATLAASTFNPTTDSLNTAHYSASKLANGNTGVPAILDNASSYNSSVAADTTDASVSSDSSITYRYVIDRQCNSGTVAFSIASCEYVAYSTTSNGGSGGGGSSQYSQRQVGGVFAGSSGAANCNGSNCAIYRISVRVAGPRNSVAYFQTTFVN